MTFSEGLRDFGTVVAAMLIVIDPLGLMPILVGLNSSAGPKAARRMIFQVAGGATVLLVFFTVTGTWVLKLFGITPDDMRVGGGLLLLIIALRLVLGGRFGAEEDEDHAATVVPLISPMTAGPGAITASVVFAAVYGIWITAAAAVAAMIITLAVFLSTRLIHRLIGNTTTDLISRVMGVFVATIAVSYIRIGILNVVKSVHVK
jgi:multiple antibiotic resistance protein